MNIKELTELVFWPERNLNKKSYTPMYIDVYPIVLGREMKKVTSYNLPKLLESLIAKDNTKDLAMLLDDFPNAINLYTSDGEILLHACVFFNAINCFRFLKTKELSLDALSLGDETVYEEVLEKPFFWQDSYNDLDSNTLYEKLTTPGYFEHGGFEKLLRGRESTDILLSNFKNSYPQVFKRVKDEYIDKYYLRELSGQTLRIVMGYDNLENELQETCKNHIIKNDNIVKF